MVSMKNAELFYYILYDLLRDFDKNESVLIVGIRCLYEFSRN